MRDPQAHPDTVSLASMPAWLLQLITASAHRADGASREGDTPIPEGQRNNALFRLAKTLCRSGIGQEAIAAAMLLENERQCKPPLGEDEVLGIAANAVRYEPGAIDR